LIDNLYKELGKLDLVFTILSLAAILYWIAPSLRNIKLSIRNKRIQKKRKKSIKLVVSRESDEG